MSALRGWGVAFLGFAALEADSSDAMLSPAGTLTILGLAGTLTSFSATKRRSASAGVA
jgi:hypothetical protein